MEWGDARSGGRRAHALMTGTSFPVTAFGASIGGEIGGVCFSMTLAIACFWDIKSRRIPNWLVVVIALLGVTYSVLSLPPATGAARSVLGFALGFALWIPFYALGMLGAGDVKLFAAAGCWLAPSQVFTAALLSALAGGALSLIGLVLAHGVDLTLFRLGHAVKNPSLITTRLPVPEGRATIPYGLAMAVGLTLVAWLPGLSRIK